MSTRTDTIIAIALPCIAIAWVIGDAAAGVVAAAQEVRAPAPLFRTASQATTPARDLQARGPSFVIGCPRQLGDRNGNTKGRPFRTLDSLCLAHRKLLSGLQPRDAL